MLDHPTPESLLLIDTCGERSSVALFREGALVGEVFLQERSASAGLLGAVREVLGGVRLRLSELSGLGVINGPGSFTGLRVGLAVVKGLCESTGLRVGTASRLAVLCDACGVQRGFGVLRAGRDEVYVRQAEEGQPAREFLVSTEVVSSLVAEQSVVYAEAALQPLLTKAATPMFVDLSAHHAYRLIQLCLQHGGVDLASLDANYVRDERAIYGKRQVGA